MPKGTRILTDVSEEELKSTVKGFEDEGADVRVEKQPNGKYTVTAVFPKKTSEKTESSVSAADGIKKTPAQSGTKGRAPRKKTLKRDGVPWTAEIDGKDIVVRKVKVTAFGGGHDPGDDGKTESGVPNDGSNPNLMGCALPIKANEAATKDSPIAFTPPIPWHTKVRFWQGDGETKAIETDLIDNGPNVKHYPDDAGDLTVAVAKKFAPQIPLEEQARRFEMTLSYRIIDGAKAIKS